MAKKGEVVLDDSELLEIQKRYEKLAQKYGKKGKKGKKKEHGDRAESAARKAAGLES